MFKNFWNESRRWRKPHQLITDMKHWSNQEVKISQTRAQCDMERGGCWCAWLVIEEVSSGENRSFWLIHHGEGIVSLPLAPHAHAVHAINYVTLPFNRFILPPHTPQPQLQQRSNWVEHPSLFFSHHLPENARRWKDSLSFLFSFLPLRRSRLSMTSSGATFTCVFSGRCRCRTASLTLLHHAVSFSIWRGHELCLTSAFFFYLQDGSIYNELWIISGHWQWSRLRLSNSFL